MASQINGVLQCPPTEFHGARLSPAGQGVGALQLASRSISDVASVIRRLGHELDYLFDHARPSGPIQQKGLPCGSGHFVWAARCTPDFRYRCPLDFSRLSGRRTFGDDVGDGVGDHTRRKPSHKYASASHGVLARPRRCGSNEVERVHLIVPCFSSWETVLR